MKRFVTFLTVIAILAILTPFTLAESISGAVKRDSDHQPIGGVIIEVLHYDNDQLVNSSYSMPNGAYLVDDIPPGTYRVRARDDSATYAFEYYNDTQSHMNAEKVEIVSGQSLENIDFSLGYSLSISGRVIDQQTSQPLENVKVGCWDPTENNPAWFETRTDSNGEYTLSQLLPGEFRVTVDSPPTYAFLGRDIYLVEDVTDFDFQLPMGLSVSGRVFDQQTSQPLGGIQVFCWNSDDRVHIDTLTEPNGVYIIKQLPPGRVEVTANPPLPYAKVTRYIDLNQDITDVDFQLPIGLSISGQVIDRQTFQPLINVRVYVYSIDDNNPMWAETWTDSNGEYTLSQLLPGFVNISVYPPPPYAIAFLELDLNQDMTDVDFQLPIGLSISGTVYDKQTSQPLGNIRVNVQSIDDNNPMWAETWTDSNGEYTLSQLLPGFVKITVYPPSPYAFAFLELDLNQDMTDVDFQLPIGLSISGQVTDQQTSQPLENVKVGCWYYTENNSAWFETRTGPNGEYTLSNLLPGEIRVQVYSPPHYAFLTRDINLVEDVTDFDFQLPIGLSISGTVYDKQTSQPLGNVKVGCYHRTFGMWFETLTESNGVYSLSQLPPGEIELQVRSPFPYAKVTRYIDLNQDMTDFDFQLPIGLSISGTVYDKQTSLPIGNVEVGCYHHTFEMWFGTLTEPNGVYSLSQLPPGEIELQVRPPSPYAGTGRELMLEYDMTDVDFALAIEATFSGVVLDANTAEPMADIWITYDSERIDFWDDTFTDEQGRFFFDGLPEGLCYITACPEIDTGYAWFEGSAYLWSAQNLEHQIITIRHGALVQGYVKDIYSNPVSDVELSLEGKNHEIWPSTDDQGKYQARLPVGDYIIGLDDVDEVDFRLIPQVINVEVADQIINLPDLILYDRNNGGQISGAVTAPGGVPEDGFLVVIAFVAGAELTAETLHTTYEVSLVDMENPGPFTLSALPPGYNYDLYLIIVREFIDEVESLNFCDARHNVSLGTDNVTLSFNTGGKTIRGRVINREALAVIEASVLLCDAVTGDLVCGAYVDEQGYYEFYYVPDDNYTITAQYSKYNDASAAVEVAGSSPIIADTIIMTFTGDKDGPDLNGNGRVDLTDLALISDQWLLTGPQIADFNQDSTVNLLDFTRWSSYWLWEGIWYHNQN